MVHVRVAVVLPASIGMPIREIVRTTAIGDPVRTGRILADGMVAAVGITGIAETIGIAENKVRRGLGPVQAPRQRRHRNLQWMRENSIQKLI
jgi:hypothetical protein